MAEYYLAVDIGASSGWHILASYEEGRICLEEVYRFENGMIERDGHLLWDTERLFAELLRGMKRCRELGKLPGTMGIDTWAVDYVLLDRRGELLDTLRLRESLFPEILPPGTVLGELRPELAEELGYSLRVLQVASHDTASAVMAVPAAERDFLYLSSGTWSLIGTELPGPCITEAARRANLTNEGGYGYRCRFLKNIMGLWMIQSLRREWGKQESFEALCRMAEENRDFPSRVDPNYPVFLSPRSMAEAIRARCAETGQRIPETKGSWRL